MPMTLAAGHHRPPPPPAGYLARPRLDVLWPDWRRRRLVLVSAGAGFGKSSFLAAGAERWPGSAAWLTLDDMDADPAAFCRHLLAALDPLRGAGPAASGDAGTPGRALTRAVSILRETEGPPLLVLDDVQSVASAAPVLRVLARLIRFLPEHATLVLSSRERLPLAAARLRSQGVVADLTGDDLRFTPEEVAALLRRRLPGREVDAALCQRVADRTEGWAAGIEIILQALDASPALLLEQALERLNAAGAGWFAYFAEEVLDHLEPVTRDFLVRSSLLPRLEPNLCDEVLRIRGSDTILAGLARRNLFTFAVDGDAGDYRTHQLFRDFLQDQLARRTGAAELGRLRRRAARALERAGAPAEAALAWAEAGDAGAVLRLAETAGEALLASGGVGPLRRALAAVPEADLAIRPDALFLLGRVHEVEGRWEEAEAIYQRALAAGDGGGHRLELVAALATLRIRRGECEAGLAGCREVLDAAGEPRLRARLLMLMGVAACELGRLDAGEAHLEAALALARERGDDAEEGRLLYLLASNVHCLRGDHGRALDLARRALVVCRRRADPRLVCHAMNTCGFVAAAAGEARAARELAEAALRMAESLEYRLVEGYSHWTLGRCDLLARNLGGARHHFEASLGVGERLREATLETWPLVGLAEVALAEGKRERGAALAVRVRDRARASGARHQEAQALVLLGAAASDAAAARPLWDEAEAHLRAMGAACELNRLLLLRLAGGAAPRGTLAELMRGAARLEHDFIFLALEPERAPGVLVRALAGDVEADYAARLLVRLGRGAVPRLASLLSHRRAGLRQRAAELLTEIGGPAARAALDRAAAPGRGSHEARAVLAGRPARPLAVSALGALSVERAGRRLGLADWKSARALRLFQLLLVHRFRWVPRDQLMETLWPEATPVKAANNLRQTIHVLRRILEPDGDAARDSRHVLVRHEACRLEPGDGAAYDVLDFEAALDEAERLWNLGRRDEAEAPLRRAAALYRGDFLAETPYEEFAVEERERLHDRMLRGRARLLAVLAAAERWEELVPLCRRVLAMDPYREDFHWHLVRAHERLGNRREALAAYHHYEAFMARELDLLPSPRMRSLADQVLVLGGD